MDEAYLETIRERFFGTAHIDLQYLEPDEIHNLLELLPAVMIYLHQVYFMPSVYKDPNVKHMIKKAQKG